MTRPPGSFGLAATILAVPGAVAALDSGFAVVLYTVELCIVLFTFPTAVWAPDPYSERAFRLLRWMTGRPEPEPPTGTR